MKALIYLSNFSGGGAERTLLNLSRVWAQEGRDILLVAGSSRGDFRAMVGGAIPLLELNASMDRYALPKLALAIFRYRPDVVLSTMPGANIVSLAAARLSTRRPRVVLRESNFRSHPDSGYGMEVGRLLGWAYHRADHLIALSAGVKADMVERYELPGAKITAIHNPIDLEGIRRLQQRGDDILPSLQRRAGSTFHLVAAGRLEQQKGFDLLLKAFAELDPARFRLAILGRGGEGQRLASMIGELGLDGRATLAGFAANPYASLAAADLFVLSSRWEGFGHVIAEAMACGTPVLSFDCHSGPAEIVTHMANGVLCEPENPAALAAWIGRLADDAPLRERLAVSGLQRSRDFDMRKISSRYWQVLEDTCGC